MPRLEVLPKSLPTEHAVRIELQEGVPIFNPRTQAWSDHFVWSKDGLHVVGLTPTGRATILELDLNRDRLVNIRRADLEVHRHPAVNDPIMS